MKSRKALLYLLLALFLTNACKDNDAAEPKVPANTVAYGEDPFSITQPGIQDLSNNTDFPSHHCYRIILTDGKLTLYENTTLTGSQGNSFTVSVRLFSPGTDAFKPGTFQYINTEELLVAEANDQVKDKFFFNAGNFSMQIGEDDDDPFTTPEYELAKAISGTVKVAGAANPYTIDIDLTMDNGKKLKANYSGNFDLKAIDLD